MKRASLLWAVTGMIVACGLARQATARDIHVAISGQDTNNGTAAAPYRSITYAVSQAVSGDTIQVHAGTYTDTSINVPSGVWLYSADGLYAAKINSSYFKGLRFVGVSNSGAEGFECYGVYGQGSESDGLVRVYNASNITLRNLLVHDATSDCDCIKVGGDGITSGVLIDGCVVYNPAPRSAGGYQECIDFYPVDNCTIRNCWLYHTPERGGATLTFCKGGSSNILWENNVFGPAYAGSFGSCSTLAGGSSPVVYPACTNFIARNNLFLECDGDGAFGLMGVKNCKFYNNIIWGYKGGRAAIQFYTPLPGIPINENFMCYNNIILQTNGKPVFADRGKYTSDGTNIPTVFMHDYNIYYQTAGGGDVDISTEAHSLITDPQLLGPAGPMLGVDTWATIVNRFLLQATSPAIDAGVSLPEVTTDILGTPRPIGIGPDIGVNEYTFFTLGITQQPATTAVLAGQAVSLQVAASGNGILTYQWRRDGVNLVDGGRISGATTPTLTVTDVTVADTLGTYDVVVSIDTLSVASNAVQIIVQGNLDWQFAQGMSGLDGAVSAITTWSGPQGEWLVIGGSFHIAGQATVNNIVAWDGTSWQALGSGMNGSVSALAVYNGQLVAGGSFTTAGGATRNRIAIWDGSSWQAMGSGMNGSVSALTVCNGQLVAGGSFTTASGATCNRIAIWDGSSWQAMGSGMNAGVSALTAYNGHLVAGGSFTTAGGAACKYIASWDGTAWQAMSSGMNAGVKSLAVYSGQLVAGGPFTTAGGMACSKIAQWDGTSWQWVGGGTNGSVTAMTVYDGQLLAGGDFTKAGSVTCSRIARWDGTSWQPLGSGMDNNVSVLGMYNSQLVVGGSFTKAGGYGPAYLARWGLVPAISQQPASQSVHAGDSLSLSVSASGIDTISYQWRKDGVNLSDGGRINGATSATVTIASTTVADAGSYDVVVTDADGAILSSPAPVTVAGLAGDINKDGFVNVGDLQMLVAAWGCGPNYAGPEDANGDGFVNVGDLQLLVRNWGT